MSGIGTKGKEMKMAMAVLTGIYLFGGVEPEPPFSALFLYFFLAFFVSLTLVMMGGGVPCPPPYFYL